MALHKYKVGQTVQYLPSRWSMRSSQGDFRVTRLLPAERGENQYRVKCTSEPFERMVSENELLLPSQE